MQNRVLAALGAAVIAIAPLSAQDSAESPTPAKPFTAAEEAHYLELGKKVNGWFFEGHADSIAAIADSGARARMGDVDGIQQMMDKIAERGGVPLTVLAEKMTRREGKPQFWFEAEFSSFTDEPLVFRWLFNDQDQLVGAGVTPKSMAKADGL